MSEVRNLRPELIWNHFEDLNAVPRPSKKEERVIQFMLDFGNKLGLETYKDSIGNVIIKKPATPGMEGKPTVILQAHLDMVHQKNNDTDFDFLNQGIVSYVEGEWVKAKGTTLGADNGMGVAAIMSVLSSNEIKHPAIEAFFTIDEETGMTGAMKMDASYLSGKILLNLDTEDDDELSVGCAGGIDTNVKWNYRTQKLTGDYVSYEIKVKGLKGGHSGMDIHLGRGNANKIMNRLLWEADRKFEIYVHSIDGGSLRNAIPRESVAVVTFQTSFLKDFQNTIDLVGAQVAFEFKEADPNLKIEVNATSDCLEVMDSAEQRRMLNTLYGLFNGVYRMSQEIEGLVETSSSLARVVVKDGVFQSQSLQRSSLDSAKTDIANAIRSQFELMGAEVEQTGEYPGWQPDLNAPILNKMIDLYKNLFQEEPQVKACHAGLECGILKKHLPDTDMVSFGPTIRNPHSPDEMVNIKSVEKFWKYLIQTLENIPG